MHHGPEANESARSFGARAYTHGSDLVFGAGEYSLGSSRGQQLLAHELTHVVQQSRGTPLLQCSPLSDSVKAAWDAEPKLEALLARLSRDDVQNDQADADVDALLSQILKGDDLALAESIRKGELGKTAAKKMSVKAFFFRGSTDRHALVIAGVHGTERQGMEVAQMLLNDLKTKTPVYSVVVVPSLFPENVQPGVAPKTDTGAFGSRESGATPTNRNFPPPSQDLAAATKTGKGTPIDAKGKAILPENIMLLELIERFHPERIISLHGTWKPGMAGVFYDPRNPRPDEVQGARDWARNNAYMRVPLDQQETPEGQEQLRLEEERLYRQRIADVVGKDRDLSLAAAKQVDVATGPIPDAEIKEAHEWAAGNAYMRVPPDQQETPEGRDQLKAIEQKLFEQRLAELHDKYHSLSGRERRDLSREGEKFTPDVKKQRQAHPSVAGNVGDKGDLTNATWGGGTPGGISLGSYAPPRGISVFTVEPPIDRASKDYPTDLDPKVTAATRKIELQAYADAVRTILLGD